MHEDAWTTACVFVRDCCLNNTLIQFIPSSHDTRTLFVNVFDLPFVNVLSALLTTLYTPLDLNPSYLAAKTWQEWSPRVSLVNRSTVASVVGGHTVLLIHVKLWQLTNIWQKFLHQKDFPTVNFDIRFGKMVAGCSKSQHPQQTPLKNYWM